MSSKIFKEKDNERTEFQLHISQYQTFQSYKHILKDFTEVKLERYLEEVSYDPLKKKQVENVLRDYKLGRLAIAWKKGEPMYVRISNIA